MSESSPPTSQAPAYDGYLADPFLVETDRSYVAYGTTPASSNPTGAALEALTSPDLHEWQPAGPVLHVHPSIGTDLWAPEVVRADGAWWMYYSAGFGIRGHHLRVARADSPLGPFIDQGINLTQDEPFAIDASPFQDDDGTRYLYFARDVLNHARPGTHLAVRRMTSLTSLDPETIPVLAPNADWQLYQADRPMYDRRFDWHTLEGPSVVRRNDTYVLFYSGGSWEGADYGASYATAPSPLGPWTHQSQEAPVILSRALTGQPGPGHNSVLQLDSDAWVTAYHAWDSTSTRRELHITPLHWNGSMPVIERR